MKAKVLDGSWIQIEYEAANRLRGVKKDDGTMLQAFQYGATNARLICSYVGKIKEDFCFR